MTLTICNLLREPRSVTRNDSLSVLWKNTLLGIVPLYALPADNQAAQDNPVKFVRQTYRDALKSAGPEPDLAEVRKTASQVLKLVL